MENFDLRIQFHPARLPAGLWWASWDGVDGDVANRQEVTLDEQHSAHRYLRVDRAHGGRLLLDLVIRSGPGHRPGPGGNRDDRRRASLVGSWPLCQPLLFSGR